MKMFFDLEFTRLSKNGMLVSIGCVSDTDFMFYGEVTDYDINQCEQWVKDNVIAKLKLNDMENNTIKFSDGMKIKYVKGDKQFIAKEFDFWMQWMNPNYNNDKFEFISDVCHYDFVLFIDLMTNGGTALQLQKNISPVCHDINADIAKFYNISETKAFDVDREEIVRDRIEYLGKVDKHNSLWDAIVIKAILEKLNFLKFYNDGFMGI